MRRWIFSVCVVLFSLLAACASKVAPRQPTPAAAPARQPVGLPGNSATLQVDTDFSEAQQAQIRDAATAWRLLSRGRADVRTVPLDMTQDTHRIVYVPEDSGVVRAIDARAHGYRVLAFTLIPVAQGSPRAIVVIRERVSPADFIWVVTHEMGHFLGLDDIDEPGHVMSGVGRFRGDWFTPSDLRECQAAGVCP